MKFTQSDLKEIPKLVNLLSKIDNLNEANFDTISDEIFQQQPFF